MGFGGDDVQRWEAIGDEEFTDMDAGRGGRGQVGRVIAYVLVAAASLHAVVHAMASIDPPSEEAFDALLGEDGWVEWTQAVLYAVAGAALLARGVGRVQRGVGWLVTAMAARELDRALELLTFERAHRIAFAALLLAGTVTLLRARRARDPASDPAFTSLSSTLLWIGALTSVGFSQLLGQRDAWRAIVVKEYGSTAKRLAEEGLELLGAVWIALAVVEQLVFARSARGGAGRGGSEPPVA